MAEVKSNIVALLREVEIFSEFTNDILEEFANNMTEVYLKKGETLFNKGDKESAMFIILNGSVEIHDGDYIFTTLNSKQFFGEYSLIDSAVRSASVTAIHNTHLLELPQSVFEKVTFDRPYLWKSILISLTKRLRDYNIVEEKLTLRTLDIQRKKFEVEQEKESITNQKKDLEAINATKDKFFTILAHDLKNPFSTVMGITDLILKKNKKLTEEQILEHIRQINQYSKNAYNLLENLLSWARSQTGSLKINFKRVNLKAITDNVIELFDVIAKQKSISLTSDVDEELFGYFDVDMITTVIRNLISNALKFTNNNGKISISAIEIDDMLQIEISDTGIGIAEQNLENLFNIEKKTIMNESGEDEGTGLGMVLIKEFILKNGGNIWVESELNVGTTIKFTLPKAL